MEWFKAESLLIGSNEAVFIINGVEQNDLFEFVDRHIIVQQKQR
jgi:hypothetical protein